MNQTGWHFAAGVTVVGVAPLPGRGDGRLGVQSWDSYTVAIVYGTDPTQAQATFREWCAGHPKDQGMETEIKRLVVTPVFPKLLTEAGEHPLDFDIVAREWVSSNRAMLARAEDGTVVFDDSVAGYWLDVNASVPAGARIRDIDGLKRSLPADLSASLNWNPEVKFTFVVSSLHPQPPPTYSDSDTTISASEPGAMEKPVPLDFAIATLPELRERDAVALVEASNAAVAAWLWREAATAARMASNELHLAPACPIFSYLDIEEPEQS